MGDVRAGNGERAAALAAYRLARVVGEHAGLPGLVEKADEAAARI